MGIAAALVNLQGRHLPVASRPRQIPNPRAELGSLRVEQILSRGTPELAWRLSARGAPARRSACAQGVGQVAAGMSLGGKCSPGVPGSIVAPLSCGAARAAAAARRQGSNRMELLGALEEWSPRRSQAPCLHRCRIRRGVSAATKARDGGGFPCRDSFVATLEPTWVNLCALHRQGFPPLQSVACGSPGRFLAMAEVVLSIVVQFALRACDGPAPPAVSPPALTWYGASLALWSELVSAPQPRRLGCELNRIGQSSSRFKTTMFA